MGPGSGGKLIYQIPVVGASRAQDYEPEIAQGLHRIIGVATLIVKAEFSGIDLDFVGGVLFGKIKDNEFISGAGTVIILNHGQFLDIGYRNLENAVIA